jgi:hypothetical protein
MALLLKLIAQKVDQARLKLLVLEAESSLIQSTPKIVMIMQLRAWFSQFLFVFSRTQKNMDFGIGQM